MKRSIRIHHKKRILKNYKEIAKRNGYNRYICEKDFNKKVSKLAETPKPCSCHMCGNPRKWFKEKSLKEKKIINYFKESLDDLNS